MQVPDLTQPGFDINTEMPKFLAGTIKGLSANDWTTELTAAFSSIKMNVETVTNGVNINSLMVGGSTSQEAFARTAYDYTMASGMPPALLQELKDIQAWGETFDTPAEF